MDLIDWTAWDALLERAAHDAANDNDPQPVTAPQAATRPPLVRQPSGRS